MACCSDSLVQEEVLLLHHGDVIIISGCFLTIEWQPAPGVLLPPISHSAETLGDQAPFSEPSALPDTSRLRGPWALHMGREEPQPRGGCRGTQVPASSVCRVPCGLRMSVYGRASSSGLCLPWGRAWISGLAAIPVGRLFVHVPSTLGFLREGWLDYPPPSWAPRAAGW